MDLFCSPAIYFGAIIQLPGEVPPAVSIVFLRRHVKNIYSRRKVVLKETELQHIHNQHSKPSKPF